MKTSIAPASTSNPTLNESMTLPELVYTKISKDGETHLVGTVHVPEGLVPVGSEDGENSVSQRARIVDKVHSETLGIFDQYVRDRFQWDIEVSKEEDLPKALEDVEMYLKTSDQFTVRYIPEGSAGYDPPNMDKYVSISRYGRFHLHPSAPGHLREDWRPTMFQRSLRSLIPPPVVSHLTPWRKQSQNHLEKPKDDYIPQGSSSGSKANYTLSMGLKCRVPRTVSEGSGFITWLYAKPTFLRTVFEPSEEILHEMSVTFRDIVMDFGSNLRIRGFHRTASESYKSAKTEEKGSGKDSLKTYLIGSQRISEAHRERMQEEFQAVVDRHRPGDGQSSVDFDIRYHVSELDYDSHHPMSSKSYDCFRKRGSSSRYFPRYRVSSAGARAASALKGMGSKVEEDEG